MYQFPRSPGRSISQKYESLWDRTRSPVIPALLHLVAVTTKTTIQKYQNCDLDITLKLVYSSTLHIYILSVYTINVVFVISPLISVSRSGNGRIFQV